MGLTIGITGHTSGFGKHIAEACKAAGHTVEGFSKSNGYDLLFDVSPVFSKKLDCIINNADIGNAQVNICVQSHRKELPCINIGSKITEATVTEHTDISTKDNKIALEDISKSLGQKYLTWGFSKGHPILENNPELETDITIEDAVKEVLNELPLR